MDCISRNEVTEFRGEPNGCHRAPIEQKKNNVLGQTQSVLYVEDCRQSVLRPSGGWRAEAKEPRSRAGGQFSLAAGPAPCACPARVAQTRDRLAVQRDRGAIRGVPQGIENINSRPEMTPRQERQPRARSLPPSIEGGQAERESPVARKGRRKPLKQRNPRRKIERSAWARGVGQKARRRVTALLIPARREDADGGQAGRLRRPALRQFSPVT